MLYFEYRVLLHAKNVLAGVEADWLADDLHLVLHHWGEIDWLQHVAVMRELFSLVFF